jgi:group I intron endonuclease
MITNFIDKYIDFSFNGKKIIKQKYNNIQGIYLWINNLNNKSYVGKSVNIFNRLNKNYLSSYYINKNKDKMAICAAILKYGIKNFTFYILEVVNKDNTSEFLSQRENY